MSHNGVAHNHPPLDSLISLVMPGTDASLGANPSIHFPPIQTKQGNTKKLHKESEGEESSVISSFSTNIPHYVSRSEILKVYDVLPAHKSQHEKEKHLACGECFSYKYHIIHCQIKKGSIKQLHTCKPKYISYDMQYLRIL